MATSNLTRTSWLTSPGRWLAIALIGGLVCAIAYWRWPAILLQAHLLAVVLWTGISIGALMLLMLHGLVGGNWGVLLRPSLISAVQPFWLLAIAFVPVALQLTLLYPWATWQAGSTAEHLWAKSPYLNAQMFLVRAAGYWALWLIGAWLVSRLSLSESKLRGWTGLHALGLPILVMSVTFAAVDWWMSLEPEWSASSYGLLILAGQGAAALALSIMIAAATRFDPPAHQPDDAPPYHTHAISPWRDVGNLLFAAICLWMYISYSQYLIIWSGNLPEEATWYLRRNTGTWKWVIVCLVLFHFAVPFMLLLSRTLKENSRQLATVAALIFAMHVLESLWLVLPSFGQADWRTVAVSALAIVSVGSAWFCLFALRFRREVVRATGQLP